MKLFRICALTLIILVSLNFTACGGGTKTDVVSETSITTLGQELQDLDKAYKDGIITEKEYNKAKEKLIKKKPNKMISAVHRSKLDRRMCLYYRQGG